MSDSGNRKDSGIFLSQLDQQLSALAEAEQQCSRRISTRVFPYFLAIRELLFPACCLGCGQRLPLGQALFLCDLCLSEVAYIDPPLCLRCGKSCAAEAAKQQDLCRTCGEEDGFVFDRARAAFAYQEPIASLILSLKFGAQLAALDTLAALARQSAALAELAEPDLILPVPLHGGRLRQRGFNQAVAIARFCFPLWREKIQHDLLQRSRATPAQMTLSGQERRKNLAGAFFLSRPEKVRGRCVLLVDDVFTTGSTLNECSRVLRRADAASIEVFTLARSLREPWPLPA